MLDQQLLDTWRINHRVTLKVVAALPDAAFAATLSARGGRDVARQFAHLHEVRLGWLPKQDVRAGTIRFARGESPDRSKLTNAFEQSADAVERTIVRACATNGQVAGFKRGIIPWQPVAQELQSAIEMARVRDLKQAHESFFARA